MKQTFFETFNLKKDEIDTLVSTVKILKDLQEDMYLEDGEDTEEFHYVTAAQKGIISFLMTQNIETKEILQSAGQTKQEKTRTNSMSAKTMIAVLMDIRKCETRMCECCPISRCNTKSRVSLCNIGDETVQSLKASNKKYDTNEKKEYTLLLDRELLSICQEWLLHHPELAVEDEEENSMCAEEFLTLLMDIRSCSGRLCIHCPMDISHTGGEKKLCSGHGILLDGELITICKRWKDVSQPKWNTGVFSKRN